MLASSRAEAGQTVRVLLLHDQLQASVSSEGGLLVQPAPTALGSTLPTAIGISPSDLRVQLGGLLLVGATLSESPLAVSPLLGNPLVVDGKTYRGTLIVRRDEAGMVRVVNIVDLDQYVASVVGAEMFSSWPAAALQAQAIAARGYAVSRTGNLLHPDYDVKAGEEDQVYKGIESETTSTISAADATRGVVLTYQGRVISAYYSACDGGVTADGNVLDDPQPYLQSMADPYCPLSPYLHWSASVPLADFSKAFRMRIGDVGEIRDVRAGPKDASGRIANVVVIGSQESREISVLDFRRIAGTHRAKSARIDRLEIEGDNLTVSGGGFGHGTGMCQYGAYGMAQAGFTAPAILRFYYRGTQLEYLNQITGYNV